MNDEQKALHDEWQRTGKLQSAEMVLGRLEQSPLSEADKANFRSFLQRFPNLDYWVSTPDEVEQTYVTLEFDLPDWFRQQRLIFSHVWAPESPYYAFRRFTSHAARRSPRFERARTLYFSNLGTVGYHGQRTVLKGEVDSPPLETKVYDIFPIMREQQDFSYLCIKNHRSGAQEVYEYDIRDIWDEYDDDPKLNRVIFVPSRVFDSYSAMLAAVCKIRIGDKIHHALKL
ncbi:hypothetical protein [Deinococcus sp.]|uniref:hypothetical protein n=1 Tax=Deinococcus sp. TaxID=47478 RepID=UPI0025DCCA62|nr:hypothetical protein [Deinococcus sp.]